MFAGTGERVRSRNNDIKASQLLAESYSGGTLAGLAVTNVYDTLLRRVTNSFWNGSTRLGQSIYGYGPASRLQTVGDGTRAVGYTYLANSSLVGQIGFTNSGTLRMTTSKQYDFLNRLLSISSAPSAAPALSFNYTYNDANQRIKVTLADASFWLYEYDALGQVQSGKRYWPDWTPVAGQQFEYAHDDIGNRSATKAGGDGNGAGLRGASYSANSLNQYTNRTVPGAVDIIGVANATATVTVNNQSTYRHGEYYRKELAVTNSAVAQWQSVTNKAVESGTTNTVIGNLFVAKTPEAFTYDADGNLTSDGHWNYLWDAENRLLEMGVSTAVGSQKYLRFEYDWQGRRIGKKVWNNAGGSGAEAVAQKFLYDGWNLIGILNSSFALQTSFTWGLDLSGSPQGAGGVGGLVAINDGTNGVHFVAHDSNGNVAALVKASDGTVSASYEYGPFGELIRATGPMGKTNPLRFSTKYQDDETDLVYYGYRFFSPTGKWISRDPIEEDGGENVYGIAGNNCVSQFDYLGLQYPLPAPPIPISSRTLVTDIPGIMTANGWNNGAALMSRWFSLPAIGPNLPDTTTIKMSWVLGFPRAKKVYDEIINQKLYANAAAQQIIKRKYSTVRGRFGDFTLSVPLLDQESVQYRPVGSLTDPVDDLFCALGKFDFKIVLKGCATASAIGITEVGVYVRDSYDFRGSQPLGFWSKASNYGGKDPTRGTQISNGDFRAYVAKTGSGGDFLVFSDLMIIKLNPMEVVFK